VDVVVDLTRLDRILRYEPGDLTVTAEAGMTVSALNEALGARGQWLPVDVAGPGSTVGGAIATNDSGPLRHRYGPPRDQLIGIRLATADGRLASAGGNVVKNVAGYDLGKLVAGSFGSLAAIVSATFKLAPVPPFSTTVRLVFDDRAALAEAAAALAASQLDPLCLEVETARPVVAGGQAFQLLVRFAGAEQAVDALAAEASALAAPPQPTAVDRVVGTDDVAFWAARGRTWDEPGALVRMSWMPAALPDVLAAMEDLGGDGLEHVTFTGRAGVGAGVLRLVGDARAEASVVERLRRPGSPVGHVVLMRGRPDVRSRVGVWPAPASASKLARAVKQAMDPAGILNASRGPI